MQNQWDGHAAKVRGSAAAPKGESLCSHSSSCARSAPCQPELSSHWQSVARGYRDGLMLAAGPQPWLTRAEGVSASPHRDFTAEEPQETETQAGSRRPRPAPLCATSPVLGSVAVRT